jgi:hypothetical protein
MNIRIGRISQWLTPTYGWCGACKTTWPFVSGHSTQYDRLWGMFPLCEKCWSERTPVERLPYYRALFERWDDPTLVDWDGIERAVLAGK